MSPLGLLLHADLKLLNKTKTETKKKQKKKALLSMFPFKHKLQEKAKKRNSLGTKQR